MFRQGEILTDLIQIHAHVGSLSKIPSELNADIELEVEEKIHPYALILTQDCDLDWDFKAREVGPDKDPNAEQKRQAKIVPNILLCELSTADILRPRLAGSDVLRRIQRHQDERYHVIPGIPAASDRIGQGLPMLIADFKRVFSIPTDELYLRLGLGAKRRAYLVPPYLQHFSSRFGYYCARVGLPETEPSLLSANSIVHALPGPSSPPE